MEIVRAAGPHAVLCWEDGKVFLTQEEYDYQMNRPDATWRCPICGAHADWDDDNYEAYLQVAEVERGNG